MAGISLSPTTYKAIDIRSGVDLAKELIGVMNKYYKYYYP